MNKLEHVRYERAIEALQAKLNVATEALDGCINELESRGKVCLALIFAKNAVSYIVHGEKKG